MLEARRYHTLSLRDAAQSGGTYFCSCRKEMLCEAAAVLAPADEAMSSCWNNWTVSRGSVPAAGAFGRMWQRHATRTNTISQQRSSLVALMRIFNQAVAGEFTRAEELLLLLLLRLSVWQ